MRISSVGSKHYSTSDSKGFSLLELLVVLVIAGLLLAVVSPNFYHSLHGLQTKQLVRNMVADIRATRNTAIQSGEQQKWTLDIKKHQYWSSAGNKKSNYPSDVNIKLTTASRERQSKTVAAIRFFPAGGSTGGKIELSQKNTHYTFEVDWLTGMVRVNEN